MDETLRLSLVDDSGLLSLVDVGTYKSFVSEDWTYEGLLQHFADQMQSRSMLVWECGDGGGRYTVSVSRIITDRRGFREIIGGIVAINDRLQLVSYDALTMAAQFEDEALPSKREAEAFIPLSAGSYRVRIVQMFKPNRSTETPDPDFLLEIEPGIAPPWIAVPWIRT